ncbi:uncharacterized protein LOC120339125 [Styela clava]
MKIICAGFWKTGTKSLAEALTILGYKVYDYDYQLFEFTELWNKLFDGTTTDDEIREELKDVDAIIDGPAIAFWEDISSAVPEAKVILTTRDEDKWYNSLLGMVNKTPAILRYSYPLIFLTPTGRKFLGTGLRVWFYCFGGGSPMFMTKNPGLLKRKFRQHNCYVTSSVPKEKLLVLNVGSGWEPLCKFLGKDIPDIPYPHKNKDASHHTTEGGPQHPKIKQLMLEFMLVLGIFVILVSYIFYFLYIYICT